MSELGVAIVGMACRFPGAPDVGRFWENLRRGVDSITRLGREQLLAAGVERSLAQDPDFVAARGVIEGGDRFDWALFGYSPAEAASIDPQQRVFLECASAALDDAAIDPERFEGWIGVFAGCDLSWLHLTAAGELAYDDRLVLGQEKDFLATRAAYKLGLRGPAVTVQTACSTALVAVHTACQSLLGYECDAALAGASSVWPSHVMGHVYREGHILSRDGRCRPFDAAASGTVASSGVGVVVLKRLEDALAARDRIVAVIRGSAVNNDGGEKVGYTAPSIPGQRDVIEQAMARAQVTAEDVGYVEAHGTGTLVGDPVEVAALAAAFQASSDHPGPCWLGAVKGNIGHAGASAGAAGLIKTACMLERRELVPTVHFATPNPALDLEATPFRVAASTMPWAGEGPLVAGVSSFGVGGTNVHVVLESPPAVTRTAGEPRPLAFCLSAGSPWALQRQRAELADRLRADPGLAAADVALTLATGRRRSGHRLAWVAADREASLAALDDARPGTEAAAHPRVAFLFPGQGTLPAGAGRAAHELLPAFRADFDLSAALVGDRFGIDLGTVLRPDADPGWLRDTRNQQLCLFAIGHALAAQLRAWGVVPSMMLGNSIGEYVAAAVAGVWSRDDALAIVHRRGAAMREAAPGAMLATAATPADLESLLAGDEGLALAVDSPAGAILAGSPERIAALRERLRARGVPGQLLDTGHAFHSPLMRPAAAALREAVAAVPARAPRLRFVSNLTGDWIEPAQAGDPGYWADHLCATVRLRAGIETLLTEPGQVVCELGPGESTSRALRRHPRWSDGVVLPLLGARPSLERERLLESLARLWEQGVDVAWHAVLSDPGARRCSLPGRALQPRVVPPAPWRRSGLVGRAAAPRGTGPEAGPSVTAPGWAEVVAAGPAPHDVLVLAGGGPGADTCELLDALAPAGGRRTAVRLEPAAVDAALAEASGAGARAPAVAVLLPDELDAATLTALDQVAERAAAHAARLVLAGSGLTAVLGTEPVRADAATVTAWVEQRGRTAPVCLLDAGTGPPPRAVPAFGEEAQVLAWRGRRWWQRAARPVPPGPAREAAGGPVAVAGGGPGLAAIAAGLAAAGLRVGACAPAETAPTAGVAPGDVVGDLRPEVSPARLSRRPDLARRLDTFGAGLVGHFLLARAGLGDGERVGDAELRRRVDPGRRLPRLVDHFLRVLADERWLRSGEGGWEVALDAGARIAEARAAGGDLDEVAGLRRLLAHCADAYPAVLDGRREPVSVLYPDGEDALLRACLEVENRLEISDAGVCLAALRQAVHGVRRRGRGRPLRILEVGAGSGGLAWPLLAELGDLTGLTYCFTDVSPLLVRRAEARAREMGLAGVRFSTFDIARDPVEQGLAPGTFDLVLAYNVVHVASSVRSALCDLARLLGAEGWLALVEPTRPRRWGHMIWGLAPGWWDFDDDLRTESCLLDGDAWARVLSEVGLPRVARFSPAAGDHELLLAAPEPPPAGPVERTVRELGRQAPGGDLGAILYVPGPGDGGGPRLWPELRRHPALAAVPEAWVVSVDPGPDSGWAGQLRRRSLDPPVDDGGAPGWRHVEVPGLDDGVLAALPDLLLRRDLPPVVRLTGAAPPPLEPAAPAAPGGELAAASPGVQEPAPADGLRQAVGEVWREVLGVPAAADGDGFFELGGESLMLVHLMRRLEDRIGARVAPAAFAATPTFAGLLELARATAAPAAAASPYIVAWNAGGSRVPLVFAAPAVGSALRYRTLAALLGEDQPCYGIEAVGVHDGRRPLDTIEEIAAHHVEALRTVRPHGPYVVGGWSTGAVVAHELARRLGELGEPVERVLCLDGYVLDTGGRPQGAAPAYFLGGLWYRLQALFQIPGLRQAPAFLRVYDATLRACLRYAPRPAPCPALVLKTGLGDVRRERLRAGLSSLYTGPVDVRPAPGRHLTMLDRPHVDALARDLREILGSAAGAHR